MTGEPELSVLLAPARPGEESFRWAEPIRRNTLVVFFLAVLLGLILLVACLVLSALLALQGRPVTALAYLGFAVVPGAALVGAWRWDRRWMRWGTSEQVRLAPRLPAFAEANGLTLDREVAVPRVRPGVSGSGRLIADRLENRLRADDGAPDPSPGVAELGDYIWLEEYAGGSRATRSVAYVAIRMPRELPTIAIQSRADGGAELEIHETQTLSLEGDWDAHFTLFCPPGFERDALQIMTPDVMAAMIDHAGSWSAVTRGAWLVFVSATPFVSARPLDYAGAFRLIRVAREVAGQAEHYRDPGAGVPGRSAVVAPLRRTGIAGVAATIAGATLACLAILAAIPLLTGGA
ncbi:hypothetical protein [Protaetiibacter intestinalis]|uniref:DUF3137 domain-containing protein n=1 Tax=Protaetiibacter intestinalis TaxID=2419774 RepID=A0A387B5D4_9MICO|nr:hypothetical protein [Protaetiibacter intestinalis]AYF98904.1 hypothetical protein D7I47_11995 [Protaetiibacter intestinalis]